MRKITNSELGRLSTEEFKSAEKSQIVIIADNIRSLNNIGSLFRTSDSFAIQKIYLCGITATPPNREIHKTALGAELTVEWEYIKDTKEAVKKVKEEGYTTAAIEQVEGAVMLDQLQVAPTLKYAVIMGNEVDGVSQEVVDMCDMSIEIPQYGTKHSLNVAVACGIVIWTISSLLKIDKYTTM